MITRREFTKKAGAVLAALGLGGVAVAKAATPNNDGVWEFLAIGGDSEVLGRDSEVLGRGTMTVMGESYGGYVEILSPGVLCGLALERDGRRMRVGWPYPFGFNVSPGTHCVLTTGGNLAVRHPVGSHEVCLGVVS